ncbi:MAG: glutamate synthase subunit beta [Phycisphaerae bacterium]
MGKPTGFKEIPRQEFRDLPVEERRKHYREFHIPLPVVQLQQQGARCMDCGVPFCHTGCPLGNLIPDWNDLVYLGDWRRAIDFLHSTNNFPEFTGRVCPAPCEESCVLGINEPPVTIKQIEYSIIERAFEEGWIKPNPPVKRTGRKIAIVGSGPAGLAAADQLNRAGHWVTVFERADRIGGLLRYGIPDFKLEKRVLDRRLAIMEAEGVTFRPGVNVGFDITADELNREFDAIVLAGGATKPRDLPIPGRELEGIHFAMEFLPQQNKRVAGDKIAHAAAAVAAGLRTGRSDAAAADLRTGRSDVVAAGLCTGRSDAVATDLHTNRSAGVDAGAPAGRWWFSQGKGDILATDKHVIIIGGGDTGSDCVGTSNRQGARSVTQFELLPKPPEGRPANQPWPYWPMKLRTSSSHEEGCQRYWSILTRRFIGEAGRVTGLETVEVEWTQSNGSRPQMREIPGSEKLWPADLVLLAMGFVGPEPDGVIAQLGVELDERGNVKTDENYRTSRSNVFACGDMRRGQSLVVWAISEGREAARSIDQHLMGCTLLPTKGEGDLPRA